MKLYLFTSLPVLISGNVYLHSPRGSNNRLNEQSAQNKNHERLFFSNNNRRGGYNVGDKTHQPFQDESGQYSMQYFQSGIQGESYLTVEWTSLLGCGYDEDGDKIHNCDIVIQTNCQSDDVDTMPSDDSYTIRNGKNTDKMPYERDPNDLYDPNGRCFIDAHDRDLKKKVNNIPNNAEDSIQFCRAKCGERGYTYAGIQYTYECWCGNDFGKYGEAPIEQCDHNCRDGSGNKCGSGWRNNVYLSLYGVEAKTLDYPVDKNMTDINDYDDKTHNYDDYEGNDDYTDTDYNSHNFNHDYDPDEDYSMDELDEDENATYDDDDDNHDNIGSNPEIQNPESTIKEDCGGSLFNTLLKRFRKDSTNSRRAQSMQSETQQEKNDRRAVSEDKNIGLHESWEFYDRCEPSFGTRYGMECKAEREQWPDGSISPWVDVAYLTDEYSNKCNDEIKGLNSRQFFECVEYYDSEKHTRKHKSMHQSEEDCLSNGGDWLGFYKVGDILDDVNSESDCLSLNNNGLKDHVWGRPMNWKDLAQDTLSAETCIILPAKLECLSAPNTRSGYLGNVDNQRTTPRFHWTLPNHIEDKRCVFRIRYIVSVDDEDIMLGNNMFYMENNDGLSLATTHSRNVFEDRSHIFKLRQRPDEIPDELTIHNLVVRGKRGNIVQTYPAVEYDFVPNRLNIPQGEAIHIQWTGSNTHKNGGPGGDGQTGDAGEGTSGTDRNNFIQLIDRKANLVAPDHNHTLFENSDWVWSSHEMGNTENKAFNLGLSMATSGYYHCENEEECERSFDNTLQDQLNNAPASYEGNVFVPSPGEYHYKCMRNDNFSNRAQKGTITVI